MSTNPAWEHLLVEAPRSRADQLADTLLDFIRRRGLQAGDRLGTLDEIRAEVGFARTTVSEAVRLLRERGVLEIRPGRNGGLFISDETPVVRMRHTLIHVSGNKSSVSEAVELREALEEAIALSAAENCSPEAAERLRAAAVDMADVVDDFEEFLHRNWHLHELVAELSPNAMMRAVYTSCLGYLARGESSHDPTAPAEYVRSRAAIHQELVEAIIAGDPLRIRAAVDQHNHGSEDES